MDRAIADVENPAHAVLWERYGLHVVPYRASGTRDRVKRAAALCATAGIDPLETGCAIRWQCSAGVRPEDLEEMQALIEGMAEGMASLFAARFQQEPT